MPAIKCPPNPPTSTPNHPQGWFLTGWC